MERRGADDRTDRSAGRSRGLKWSVEGLEA
jgi:hypothetical protein